MRPLLTKTMLGFLFVLFLGQYAKAQVNEEEGSQVKVKITKEINGEQKTYEGTYNTEEEMQADQHLKEFIGEDDQMSFWFGTPSEHRSSASNNADNQLFFRFDGGDEERMASHFRMMQPNDSTMREFEINMQKLAAELGALDKDHLEKLRDAHAQFFSFGVGEDFNLHRFSPDSANEEILMHFRKLDEQDKLEREVEISVKKYLKISENVGEAFGRKGSVKKDDLLDLDDLSYYPNPSTNGRFKLKFNMPSEGELSIKVYDLDGREAFNRYFKRFNGLYAETIDLSGQSGGVYLLEIRHSGKRLTRKIMID